MATTKSLAGKQTTYGPNINPYGKGNAANIPGEIPFYYKDPQIGRYVRTSFNPNELGGLTIDEFKHNVLDTPEGKRTEVTAEEYWNWADQYTGNSGKGIREGANTYANQAEYYQSVYNITRENDLQALEAGGFDTSQFKASTLGTGATGIPAQDNASQQPKYGDPIKNEAGQTISPTDPNYDRYAAAQGVQKTNQYGQTMAEANDPAQYRGKTPEQIERDTLINRANATETPGIAELLMSGQPFNETDARNFAYFKGEKNWQQYVGGVAGQPNQLYISNENWQKLQKQYTPYQLQQATTRTKDGIYWNPAVNIGEIPRQSPTEAINADTNAILDVVNSAKDEADKMTNDAAKGGTKNDSGISADTDENEAEIMRLLNDQYGTSAEALYNELFKTPDITNAQQDVIKYQEELDEYDEQMEELKNDIRREVEGEAAESYITALATIRGEKILKQKRLTQRQYDTALANLNNLLSEASNLLQVRIKDADTRYNNLFNMLQLQIQQEGTAFNQQVALANIAMQLPEGRTMQIGDTVVKGLKENDNLNVVQFTEADGSTYVIGVDKKTGEQKYKSFIGRQRVPGSGTAATQQMNLDEALYWLSLVKGTDKYGNDTFDLNSIPAEQRRQVVQLVAANKGSLPTTDENPGWWARQIDDLANGSWWNMINPLD